MVRGWPKCYQKCGKSWFINCKNHINFSTSHSLNPPNANLNPSQHPRPSSLLPKLRPQGLGHHSRPNDHSHTPNQTYLQVAIKRSRKIIEPIILPQLSWTKRREWPYRCLTGPSLISIKRWICGKIGRLLRISACSTVTTSSGTRRRTCSHLN